MPTTSPELSSNAPPESPPMMSASTSIRLRRSLDPPALVGDGDRAVQAVTVRRRRSARHRHHPRRPRPSPSPVDAVGIGVTVVRPVASSSRRTATSWWRRSRPRWPRRLPGPRHGHRDAGRALDDVMVGDDEAVAPIRCRCPPPAGAEADLAGDVTRPPDCSVVASADVERGRRCTAQDVAVRHQKGGHPGPPGPVAPAAGATEAMVSGRASAAAATAEMGRRRRPVDRWSIGMAPR